VYIWFHPQNVAVKTKEERIRSGKVREKRAMEEMVMCDETVTWIKGRKMWKENWYFGRSKKSGFVHPATKQTTVSSKKVLMGHGLSTCTIGGLDTSGKEILEV